MEQVGNRSIRRLVLVMSISVALCGQSILLANEATNREILRTYVQFHMQMNEFSQAEALLKEHLKADPKDIGAWGILGEAYLADHQESQAADAFYQGVTRAGGQEGMPNQPIGEYKSVFLYHYADALIRLRQVEKAQVTLRLAARSPYVKASAERALTQLRSGFPLPTLEISHPSQWKGSMMLGGGYDTNVMFISDQSLATSSVSGAASPYAMVLANAGYTQPKDRSEWAARLGGSFIGYSKKEAQAYNALSFSGATDWSQLPAVDAGFSHRVGDQFDISFLNSAGLRFYNWTEALGWKGLLRHWNGQETLFSFPLRYQDFYFAAGDDPANRRSGFGIKPEVTHKLPWHEYLLVGTLGYEHHEAEGANYIANTFSANLAINRQVFWMLGATGTLGAESVSYPQAASGRSDMNLKASGTLNRRWGNWAVTLDYTFNKNLSTLDSATYTKHSFLILGAYEFL